MLTVNKELFQLQYNKIATNELLTALVNVLCQKRSLAKIKISGMTDEQYIIMSSPVI